MKIPLAAIVAMAAGLVAANMLGVAAAEAPTTATPVRTVSVDGVATVPIAQGADLTVATSAYRQGMAAAMADGQSKAEFLSSKAGTTLGSVQNIIEGGGSIGCTDGEESDYVEYQGEQPDFGSPAASASPAVDERAAVPHPKKNRKKKKKPSAKAAAATTCTLTTDVSLVYTID
jgi:hypothetical protein